MKLGAFSVSLTVKDLQVSLDFYQQLGFEIVGGVAEQGWLVLNNQGHKIGLFQGMFDKNLMTFNPGWNQGAEAIDDFDDVRDIQKRLKAAGIALTTEVDPDSQGPGHIALMDPDGNALLIDQHVPRKKV